MHKTMQCMFARLLLFFRGMPSSYRCSKIEQHFKTRLHAIDVLSLPSGRMTESHLSNKNILKQIEIPKIHPNVSQKDFHSPKKDYESAVYYMTIYMDKNCRRSRKSCSMLQANVIFWVFGAYTLVIQETYVRNVIGLYTQLLFAKDMEGSEVSNLAT